MSKSVSHKALTTLESTLKQKQALELLLDQTQCRRQNQKKNLELAIV